MSGHTAGPRAVLRPGHTALPSATRWPSALPGPGHTPTARVRTRSSLAAAGPTGALPAFGSEEVCPLEPLQVDVRGSDVHRRVARGWESGWGAEGGGCKTVAAAVGVGRIRLGRNCRSLLGELPPLEAVPGASGRGGGGSMGDGPCGCVRGCGVGHGAREGVPRRGGAQDTGGVAQTCAPAPATATGPRPVPLGRGLGHDRRSRCGCRARGSAVPTPQSCLAGAPGRRGSGDARSHDVDARRSD